MHDSCRPCEALNNRTNVKILFRLACNKGAQFIADIFCERLRGTLRNSSKYARNLHTDTKVSKDELRFSPLSHLLF